MFLVSLVRLRIIYLLGTNIVSVILLSKHDTTLCVLAILIAICALPFFVLVTHAVADKTLNDLDDRRRARASQRGMYAKSRQETNHADTHSVTLR
jgi:hypothetical protein